MFHVKRERSKILAGMCRKREKRDSYLAEKREREERQPELSTKRHFGLLHGRWPDSAGLTPGLQLPSGETIRYDCHRLGQAYSYDSSSPLSLSLCSRQYLFGADFFTNGLGFAYVV